MAGPILIGGNGHSGTRIFAEILAAAGIRMGTAGITRSRASYDLNIRGLLTRWVGPYLRNELTGDQRAEMAQQFRTRLRLYFPTRWTPWGFKNPRSMLLLPFYDELLAGMRFVHVIRDGRDVTLGNVLAGNAEYIAAYVDGHEPFASAEEKMIAFWGRSNATAADYGKSRMSGRYLQMRFEDLCTAPRLHVPRLLEFAGASPAHNERACALVQRPGSIGRWQQFPKELVGKVEAAGRPWLDRFGYGAA